MLWSSSSTEPKNIVAGKKVRLTSFLASFTHNFYHSSGPVKIVSMSENYRKLFGNYSQKLPQVVGKTRVFLCFYGLKLNLYVEWSWKGSSAHKLYNA